MLEISQLQVNYDSRTIISGVDLSVRSGEILVVLGANGAGKTTLLKALNLANPVAGGEIRFNGDDIKQMSRRQIASIFSVVAQENELRFPVTVMDYVLAGRFVNGKSFGWETAEDLIAARFALEECELTEFADRYMNELSGGERQRAVLARAFAADTPVLLLDEPTANLDPSHQISLLKIVKNKCREQQKTAIVIMHDLNMAAEFGDEFMLLHDGGVYAFGSAGQVLNEQNIAAVFGLKVTADRNPATGNIRITPQYRI